MAEPVHRGHGDGSVSSGLERHGEDSEAAPGKHSLIETLESEGARAPILPGKVSRVQQLQRKQAPGAAGDAGAPPAEATTPAPGAATAQVIVDDEVAVVGPGQVKKSAFIAQLKPLLEEVASAELGALFATAGCPYIAHYLGMYSTRSARECEAFIRRFTGSKATTTPQLVADLLVRVRAGVKAWRDTGQVPADLAAAAGVSAPPPAAAGAAAPGGLAIQHKDAPGAAGPTAPAGTPAAVLAQLGEGAPLDGTTRARMESAFGTSFGDVRVHADAQGAALASQHGALAFTVGAHIAVAAGRYAPGTPAGDALLAHELTHVLQQRGAAPGSAVTNTETGQNPSAEHDADQGAEAALHRLHGGEQGKDKDKKAGAKQSSDFQLQRCIGTAEAPTLYGPGMFHRNVYTWDGDPFAVMIEYKEGKPIGGTPTPGWLEFSAKYAGSDDSNGDVAVMSGGNLAPGKKIAPQLSFDRSDGWSKLTVDLYGDGSWVADIRHTTVFTEGWTPKSRTHQFDGRGGAKPFTTPHPVTVKSKDAVPASSQDKQPASDGTAAPAPAVRVDVAAQVAKRHLDALMADPNLQLDPNAAPWAALKPKIDAAATKYASTTTDGAGDGARLTRVGDAMQQAKPMLIALGAASHKEAFLPDIADQCLELVKGVRAQFVAAIGAAWDGDASAQIQAAMKAFEVMWYRVSSLYLAQGKGAGAMLDNARATAQQVLMISNRAGMGVPKLQAALGVTTGPPTGDDVITQKNHELAQIREDFMAGKPGALGKTTKIVEDAQVLTGLASILVLGELFRKFKDEMKGITGGVMDTFGRDLSAVCDDYIGTFDGMSKGVEDKILGFNPNLTEIGRPAVDRLQKLTNSEKFKTDVKAIESRIKNIALVQTLAKVLVIVGAAALTAGVAGAAVGGALEGAGATAGVIATGEFAAEVTTFTLVSRAGNQVAFGKNETSFAEDLITNAVMLGALKAASAAYGRVFKIFADPKKYKIAYGAGAAATGFVALQAFAEAHYAFKHDGKLMDGDERAQSLIQNAVMFAALTLGGFLAKPLNQRVRGDILLKVAEPRLAAIESQLKGLGAEVEGLKTNPKGADAAAELCKKIEGLWNEELRQLGEAAKAEKDNPTKAAEQFKATVAAYQAEIAKLDLQLSQMGLEVQLSPKMEGNLFRAIRPGYVAFRPEGLEILKDFYVKDGGTLTEVKDGQFAGKSKAGDEVYYVPEEKVPGVFEAQRAKPPTESEAAANHAEAERARKQLELRSQKCTELLVQKLVDGHVTHKFGRIVQGTGLAAALDANTLPGAQKGANPAALGALPDTIGVGTGADTFAKLGDIPIGQAAPELGGPGWAMEPGQFTASHAKYAPASVLADATSVTQYRSGTPIVDAAILEMSTTRDASWKVPDAKVRIKVKLPGHGEVFLYCDATDIALGLGKPRELELNKIATDEPTAKQYKQQLEANGRLVYGDQPSQQKAGKVLVSGGSATAAWNARYARGLGAEVDWIAEDRSPTKDPTSQDSKRRYERVQEMLASGQMTPDAAAKEMAEIRAFDAAALPTNVQAKDAAMSDAGIKRSVKAISALKPVGDAKVEVTFTDGSKEVYDQVVVSHATDITAPATPGPAGAVTIGKSADVMFKPVVRNGKVVALESVNPPGAVRVIGAAMWTAGWLPRIPTDVMMADPLRPGTEISARELFETALKDQAKGGPRDSPASALVHHVAEQIPAANQ